MEKGKYETVEDFQVKRISNKYNLWNHVFMKRSISFKIIHLSFCSIRVKIDNKYSKELREWH